MFRQTKWFLSILLLMLAAQALAADLSEYERVVILYDSARAIEAPVFAPISWGAAEKLKVDIEDAIRKNYGQKSLDRKVAEFREYVENSLKATEVCLLTLGEYLPRRNKAIEAGARELVPDLFNEADRQLIGVTARIEDGNVKGGLKNVEEAMPYYDQAEFEAIRKDILGKSWVLIDKAETDEARKYALSTLNKATTNRDRADQILQADRYNRDEAIKHARIAEYEARHASNIAQSVRALERNDQAWEKLMLVYEIQMNAVGKSIGLDHLPFDNGPQAAADTLILYIESLQKESETLRARHAEFKQAVADKTAKLMAKLNETSLDDDPLAMINDLDVHLANLLESYSSIQAEYAATHDQLTEMSAQHEAVSVELDERLAREEKFKEAKRTLNPSEGEVLFNSSNDIVIRLHGLSFSVGKSDIVDEHVPILRKCENIVAMFPEAKLVLEGHTDATGDPQSNLQLSEKRAYAVMQYLRQSMLIPAERISAIGYGSEKPVASNLTDDGRAKNRRIDIIIMQ